jgi:hypothetical protein
MVSAASPIAIRRAVRARSFLPLTFCYLTRQFAAGTDFIDMGEMRVKRRRQNILVAGGKCLRHLTAIDYKSVRIKARQT